MSQPQHGLVFDEDAKDTYNHDRIILGERDLGSRPNGKKASLSMSTKGSKGMSMSMMAKASKGSKQEQSCEARQAEIEDEIETLEEELQELREELRLLECAPSNGKYSAQNSVI